MKQLVTKNIQKIIGAIILVLLFVTAGQTQDRNTSQVASVYYPVADYGSQIAELERTLDLKIINKTLEEALFTISSKANLEIAFNSKVFGEPNAKITIVQEKVSVADALIYVLEGTGYEAVMTGKGEIILQEVIKAEEEVFQETVSGTVIDEETGEALPGVNVVVEGSEEVIGSVIGTTTDMEGEFELGVPDLEETLIFSFVGYQRLEVDIMDRTELDIKLMPDVQMLDDIVVIGYGTQRRETMTGAVSSVNAERMAEVKTVNASELVQGQLSGVHTRQTSGQPGTDDVNINIRGFGDPLILVDGVERNLSDVDPESIESISVLKDASAAIYGARGGNGVVLVTTKRGEFDRPLQITYEGSFTGQQFTNKPKMITDAGEYLELWNEAETNVGLTPTYDQAEIESYKAGEPGYESYDWFDYTFHNFSPRHQQSLSVDGGGRKHIILHQYWLV